MPEINTLWLDQSDYNNDGAITGATLKYDGRFGQTLSFDGSNDKVVISDSAELRYSTAFSLCLWVKRMGTSSDSYGTVITKAVSSGTRNYNVYWSDLGVITFRVRDKTNGADRVTSKSGYNETGTWRFLVGVYDGTNITLYVDTIASTATAVVGTIYTGVQDITIGRLSYTAGSGYYFNGEIDQVMLFNRELKTWEIKALYQQGKPSS